MIPVITVVTSVLVLKESVTWVSVVGTALAVAGLSLSEYHGKGREFSKTYLNGCHQQEEKSSKKQEEKSSKKQEEKSSKKQEDLRNGFTE